MDPVRSKTIHYKRSHFTTQLPVDYLYSPSHCWMAKQEAGVWTVGLTKFATRMLGEMVDHGFDTAEGAAIEPGQVLGWVEGFKAISDLFCTASGVFRCGNPILKEQIDLVNKDCYVKGWFYRVEGAPDSKCVDVRAYQEILDKTIDRIMEKQKEDEIQ